MPGASKITLTVNGNLIEALDGSLLDADVDGNAGGVLTSSFTTVSTTSVVGTKLIGKVVDPGADLDPMTFDDIRRGPDGIIHTADDVFLNPIAHAKVYILGQEDKFVFTRCQRQLRTGQCPGRRCQGGRRRPHRDQSRRPACSGRRW